MSTRLERAAGAITLFVHGAESGDDFDHVRQSALRLLHPTGLLRVTNSPYALDRYQAGFDVGVRN